MHLLGKVIPSAFPIMIVHALTGYESLYQRFSCLPLRKKLRNPISRDGRGNRAGFHGLVMTEDQRKLLQ